MAEQLRSELQQRLGFYDIDPKDPSFAAIGKALDDFGKDALDSFYRKVASTPETARFFPDKAAMDRAHAAQTQHWRRAFADGLGDTYLKRTETVGDVHARIGLEPKWYIGGYANILEHLITGILSRGMRSMSPAAKADRKMICALIKVAMLDMDLAVSRYFEVEQRNRQAVIANIGKVLGDISAGDLTTTVPHLPKEYAAIEEDLQKAINRLNTSFADILDGSGQIASTANEIRTATDDLARRSEQQAASLEESAAAMDELTSAITATNQAMHDLNASVGRTHEAARGGEEVVKQAINAMGEIQNSSGEIAKIIGIIDDIAFQTNLLALNAGVEAARVGEHGRGFAVVANEVRSLAQSSANAADQIKALIKNSTALVSNGARMVNGVGDALSAIIKQVADSSTVAEKITESAAAQSGNLKQVNTAIAQMSETTQHNAAMVEENNAAMHTMAAEAGRVATSVSQFRVQRKQKLRNVA